MKLVDVQIAALKARGDKTGFAYFMEQGLGKTLTTLADFDDMVKLERASRLAVVCPNSFKSGWRDEIDKWGFDFNAFIYDGDAGAAKRWMGKGFNQPPTFIINYESMRTETGQDLLREFSSQRRSMITFDESIGLKDNTSKQTKAALNITKLFAEKRILSGKPVTQGPHDLWGQMRAIGQLEGRNFYAFKTLFCKMGGFKMKQVIGAQNEDYLATLIEPYVFRALKADWTDLPQKSWTIREYKMTAEMQAKYNQMEQEFVLWLESGDEVAVDAAITKYIKLAQIQAGFILREDGTTEWLVPDERNPRLNVLKDVLETEVTGKVAIPYVHRAVYDSLMRAFGDRYQPAWIKGQMRPDEIAEQKRRFNEDPSCKMILLQTRASKYGHTLIGDQTMDGLECRTMVFYENSYSLDDRSQIEDRIHRHGQNWAVTYIDLSGTPLDRNAVKALQRKEAVYQSVFKNIRAMR